MGNVTKHFLIGLFDILLGYIVLINFLGWTGGYIDLLGSSDFYDTSVTWQNSYFGFQSIQTMFSELDYVMFHSGSYFQNFSSLGNFYQNVNDLLDAIGFGIPKLLSKIANEGNINFADILTLLSTILIQPILVIIRFFMVLATIIWYGMCLLTVLFRAFAGHYNIPFENLPDWYSHSTTSNDISISEYIPPII